MGGRAAGLPPIIRSMGNPPVRWKRAISTAAAVRKMMLRTVV